MAQGFIYILINPSIPDCVKIGKTQRSPDERARELSAATGVPTPFMVAYEERFADCDYAESYIHELLEQRGVRTAANREFFSLRLPDAIRIVMDAKANLGDRTSIVPADARSRSEDQGKPWESIFEQGLDAECGLRSCIQDKDKAISLYKQGIRLGGLEGYLLLADAICDESPKEAFDWLKRGGEAGAYGAWLELGCIFNGLNSYYRETIPPHPQNAVKAFRLFFRQLDLFNFQEDYKYSSYWTRDGNSFYFLLLNYLELLRFSEDINKDKAVINAFIDHFKHFLVGSGTDHEVQARQSELAQLLERPMMR